MEKFKEALEGRLKEIEVNINSSEEELQILNHDNEEKQDCFEEITLLRNEIKKLESERDYIINYIKRYLK